MFVANRFCLPGRAPHRAAVCACHRFINEALEQTIGKKSPLRRLHKALMGLAMGCALLSVGCSDRGSDILSDSTQATQEDPTTDAASQALREVAEKQVAQAVQSSLALRESVVALLRAASMETLTGAQQAWRKAANDIESLHVFSLLGAPSNSAHPHLFNQQYNLAAWPIQPGYLDAYGDHPYSGLVYDVGIPLTTELLRGQHGLTSEGDASLGIYAIEFLLFGESNNRGPMLFQPITSLNEQHKAAGYEQVHELPRNRRRQLLQLQADLLAADLQQLQQYWQTQEPQISPRDYQLATLAMTTGQILDTTQLQNTKSADTPLQRLTLSRQLAERISAQLEGWQQGLVLTDLPNQDSLLVIGQNILESLNAMIQAAPSEQPMPDAIKAMGRQWKTVYQHLRRLAAEVSGKTTGPGNTEPLKTEQ